MVGGMSEELPSSRRARFEELTMPLARMLYGVAVRWTGRPEDAADLVQETYLRAYRTFDGFETGTNAKAWLFTIMRSVFINSYRSRQRRPTEVAIEEMEARWDREVQIADPNAHREILENPRLAWRGSEVARALEDLPGAFREAVTLVDLGDLSYEEAAAAAGCPVGTLRSRLHRGRRLLALELVEYARSLGLAKEES
jgi:RNA polymerase sigma-70 factor (ECF subfamily)